MYVWRTVFSEILPLKISMKLGMVVHAPNLSTREARDWHRFDVTLSYIFTSRTAWATV